MVKLSTEEPPLILFSLSLRYHINMAYIGTKYVELQEMCYKMVNYSLCHLEEFVELLQICFKTATFSVHQFVSLPRGGTNQIELMDPKRLGPGLTACVGIPTSHCSPS